MYKNFIFINFIRIYLYCFNIDWFQYELYTENIDITKNFINM